MADNEKNIVEELDQISADPELSSLESSDAAPAEDIEDLVHVGELADDGMPVIPLRGITIFPTMLLHFDVGREKSVSALENARLISRWDMYFACPVFEKRILISRIALTSAQLVRAAARAPYSAMRGDLAVVRL